jgi:hypothetical protein
MSKEDDDIGFHLPEDPKTAHHRNHMINWLMRVLSMNFPELAKQGPATALLETLFVDDFLWAAAMRTVDKDLPREKRVELCLKVYQDMDTIDKRLDEVLKERDDAVKLARVESEKSEEQIRRQFEGLMKKTPPGAISKEPTPVRQPTPGPKKGPEEPTRARTRASGPRDSTKPPPA